MIRPHRHLERVSVDGSFGIIEPFTQRVLQLHDEEQYLK